MASINPIQSDIDFEAEGLQRGCLRLPHSSHRSAYGWLPIPVLSARRGRGRKVVLMAGNHGDEFEGQVLLAELWRTLTLERVQGQLLLLPAANAPAAEASRRTSPLDEGNLNRSFPGHADGGPTAQIAHYIERVILAGADVLLDIHAGGSSLRYLPTLMTGSEPDRERERERRRLIRALAVPHVLHDRRNPDGYFSTSAATRQGAIGFTLEVGGGGELGVDSLATARTYIRRLLRASGVYRDQDSDDEGFPARHEPLQYFDASAYCYASAAGLFEPLVELGASVTPGQPAARLHHPDEPDRPPHQICFDSAGTVLSRRTLAPSRRGDCLFHLGTRPRR